MQNSTKAMTNIAALYRLWRADIATPGVGANMTDALEHPRRYHRYQLEVPVIFSWKDAHKIRQEHKGLTRDLSVGGAYVFATTAPPLDARIKLKGFLPPGGKALPARIFGQGQVVRVETLPGSLPAGFAVAIGRISFHKWAKN